MRRLCASSQDVTTNGFARPRKRNPALLTLYALFLFCVLVSPYLMLFDPFRLGSGASTASMTRREPFPQQLRLSVGEDERERVVTFSTPIEGEAAVVFGTESGRYDQRVAAETFRFAEENPRGLQFLHYARLVGLQAGQTYYYAAKLDNSTSPEYAFVMPARSGPMKFVVFGDLGFVGGEGTIARIIHDEIGADVLPTAVLHTGDIAYHLNDDGGMEGDLFMQMVEPISARVPYMTCVGNHERGYGNLYHHYAYRLCEPQPQLCHLFLRVMLVSYNSRTLAHSRMPGRGRVNGNMWYSWNAGLIHFIALDTDHIDNREVEITAKQREWLINDLEAAQLDRAKRPWIIVYAHHPMYCSNTGEYCSIDTPNMQAALEDIFLTYGVDVFISSHQHSYERLWPVVKGQVLAYHYDNLKAPFQVISGSGGCPLVGGFCFDPTLGARGPWSAYRWWFPAMTGYDRMVVHNATHITWEHVLSGSGYVVDAVTISQPDHGPYLT